MNKEEFLSGTVFRLSTEENKFYRFFVPPAGDLSLGYIRSSNDPVNFEYSDFSADINKIGSVRIYWNTFILGKPVRSSFSLKDCLTNQ